MNIKKFLDAMGELDDRYIEEPLFYKKQRKKFGWMKCVTAAACAGLVCLGALSFFQKTDKTRQPAAPQVSYPQPQEEAFVEIASLFAEKGDYIEEQAEEVVSIPVGTYTGRYVKAASVDRERLMQSTGKAVSGTENWYYVSGHEDRQYLIQKLDGEYSLWKFQCFESSEYPYRDVLELVYRIDSAEAISEIRTEPVKISGTE